MSNFIKQKQIQNLQSDLAGKANSVDVLKKNFNLSDLNDTAQARTNLDVHSKAEVNALIAGAENAYNVATIADRNALTGLKVTDRVFVSNDGDGKWALYIVVSTTDGLGSNSEFQKIADQDIFDNAMTASAIKTAYESNANTNAYTDAEKTKVSRLTVTQAVNLDTMESDITKNKNDISSAQTTANSALNAANSKEDEFTEVEEMFTGLVHEANTDFTLSLGNPIKSGHIVKVYFGALKVNNVNYSPGGAEVSINVPYETDESDEIRVLYSY
jgi:hypothetical protein